MDKLIEIDGRVIHVSYKTIEINGSEVITEGDIKIINTLDNGLENKKIRQTNQTDMQYDVHFA